MMASYFRYAASKAEKELEDAYQQTENLLLNTLPLQIVREIKAKGYTEAQYYEQVTVMFTDFRNFTQLTEKLSPPDLVGALDSVFKEFDNITEKYGIEKIKTIGDSYMCAAGLPVATHTHATDMVNAALEIQAFVKNSASQHRKVADVPLEMRIGIHTGPVIAGVIGTKKFAYDIWGDTVNIASRMESSGEAGKINISENTYQLVKDRFSCTHRGRIYARHKGEIDMYFVNGTPDASERGIQNAVRRD